MSLPFPPVTISYRLVGLGTPLVCEVSQAVPISFCGGGGFFSLFFFAACGPAAVMHAGGWGWSHGQVHAAFAFAVFTFACVAGLAVSCEGWA